MNRPASIWGLIIASLICLLAAHFIPKRKPQGPCVGLDLATFLKVCKMDEGGIVWLESRGGVLYVKRIERNIQGTQ